MSMFRRPTEDSSDSESSSGGSDSEELDHSNAGTEEIVGADLTRAGTVSSGEDISVDHSQNDTVVGDVEHVRSMMLASLLEDFYRTRAAELFNAANPAANLNRQSPEVQPLAKSLFAEASQALLTNGLLPANFVSNEVQNTREQYLAGFDQFGLQNITNNDLFPDSFKRRISDSMSQLALLPANQAMIPPAQSSSSHPIRDLALRTERLAVIPHPTNDMKLSSVQPPRSHYKSSFQEMRLLGRGGFGRVYQTYNVFDKREYAVKKIPLSIKLSQQYREKGHTELASILKEVQALAQLDHCNVVRYHATWIEDPSMPYRPPEPSVFKSPFNRQRLLTNKPSFTFALEDRRRSSTKYLSDGIEFGADSADGGAAQDGGLEWSHHSNYRRRESSVPDSDLFTDGMARNWHPNKVADDPSCYVLHVQMSMYPITLAQYLSPAQSSSSSASSLPSRRHCFHLVPALRILLGILCGIQYIHARGLVHRDIKPSNIFLSSHETMQYGPLPEGFYNVGICPRCPGQRSYHLNPRIGDFGLVADLARDGEVCTGSKNSANGAIGTEYYRPPVMNGKKSAQTVDERLDVYALGVVFVELLWSCGTSMERLKLLKEAQKGVTPIEIVSAMEKEGYSFGIREMVENCIKGMLQTDHSLRWNSSKVRDQLETVLARCISTERGLG